jgi:hypothetical protein
MNKKSYELLKKFIPDTYLHQAQQAQIALENEIRILIEKVSNKFNFHSLIVLILYANKNGP